VISADRWTCEHCNRTYHAPNDWEVPVWMAARRAAQILHAKRHGHGALFERRRRRDDPDPE
jgi:hypothetical protein